jgi:hypothetical protein
MAHQFIPDLRGDGGRRSVAFLSRMRMSPGMLRGMMEDAAWRHRSQVGCPIDERLSYGDPAWFGGFSVPSSP